MSRTSAVFMLEFHAMLAMNSSSVSIGYGSRFTALVITMCINPCADNGVSHEYALSMRSGRPCVVDHQVFRPRRIAVGHAFERRVRRKDDGRIVLRQRADRNAARIRRLGAKAAGIVERAQQHLQQMQRAAGLKAVGMRGDAAHRVHRDGPADHLVVRAAVHVGPADRQFDRLLERYLRHFQREPGDRLGGNAALCGHALGRIAIVEIAFGRKCQTRSWRDGRREARSSRTAPARCRADCR